MLLHAMSPLTKSMEVTVFATTEVFEEPYMDRAAQALIVPCYARKDPTYSGLLDALTRYGPVDILHVEHEYGIYGDGDTLLRALDEAKRERLTRAVVITMHTVYHPYSGRSGALRFQEGLPGVVDAVIVHSRLQEFELQTQGVPAEAIYRIPHGTLINPYLGYPRGQLAKSLGLDPGVLEGLVLVTPGFIRRDKGLDVLAEALRGLGEGFTFVAAGEPRNPEVLEYIVDLQEEGRVIIIDRYLSSDEILRLIALSDAIVLAYRDVPGTYSVSGILHLSMGSLKPIIGTRTPRLIELYSHAPRMTIPPGNSAELARLLRWIKQNYDYAVAYMAETYAYAARTEWHRIARRHIALYRRIASRLAAGG